MLIKLSVSKMAWLFINSTNVAFAKAIIPIVVPHITLPQTSNTPPKPIKPRIRRSKLVRWDHDYSTKTAANEATKITSNRKTLNKAIKSVKAVKDNREIWQYHRCVLCPYRTKWLDVIKSHYKRHRATKKFDCTGALERYQCHLCGFKTGIYINLKKHLKTHSEGFQTNTETDMKHVNLPLKKYNCDRCSFKTLSQFLYIVHYKKCPVRNYIDGKEIDNVAEKTGHKEVIKKNTIPKTKKFVNCPYCQYKNQRRSYVVRHLRVHCRDDENRWYHCRMCLYKTASPETMHYHLKDHMKEKQSTAAGNPKSPPHVATKNSNRASCYKCKKCQFTSNCVSSYNNHLLSMHGKDTDIKWLSCNKCRYKTIFSHLLKNHRGRKHKNNIQKCQLCTFRCKNYQRLKKHLIDKHSQSKVAQPSEPSSNITWYRCNHSDFKTQDPDLLKKHILLTHVTTETVICYKCDLCTFKASENEEIRRHVLETHVDPQFNDWVHCQVCPEKFKTDVEFKEHVMAKHIM